MIKTRLCASVVGLLLVAGASLLAGKAGPARIDPRRIRAHVKALSSDAMEGRGMGQKGGDLAADYIATELKQYGLKPAGEEGTYFQKVPMVGVKTLPETSFELLR